MVIIILRGFFQPHMRNARHPYPYDENMHGYRGELDRWPDRINAPHTMRPSDNVRTSTCSSTIIRLLNVR